MASYCAGLVQVTTATMNSWLQWAWHVQKTPCHSFPPHAPETHSFLSPVLLCSIHCSWGKEVVYKVVSFMTEHQEYFKLNSITVLFFELLEGYLHNYFFYHSFGFKRKYTTDALLSLISRNSGCKCVICKDSHSLEKPPFSVNHSR